MPQIPHQIIDTAVTKWTVAGTVKRRWFVFAAGLICGFLLRHFL